MAITPSPLCYSMGKNPLSRLEELLLSDRLPEDFEDQANGLLATKDNQGAKELLAELKMAGFL